MTWRGIGAAVTIAGAIGGCRPVLEIKSGVQTRDGADRIESHGLVVEYATAIDRITYFGPVDGPNLLYVTRLEEAPKNDGSYTFFGGCYSWVSPQNGDKGWRGEDGATSAWPPDPAMDVGPAARIARSKNSITTRTPMSRAGLIEQKTFTITSDRTAELRYTLRNAGTEPVDAGTWLNTAVSNDHVIAVRYPNGSQIWGWGDASAEPLTSAMSAPDDKGWSRINLSEYNAGGGTKYYVKSVSLGGGESAGSSPEIAIWTSGWWLHRRIVDWSADALDSLSAHGEGPVAVYIQRDEPIIEAELYGKIQSIAPGTEVTTTEVWTLIPSETPDVSVLP